MQKYDESKKDEFLEALESCLGVITFACRKIGIGRRLYYNWRDADPEFKAKADEMLYVANDYVESALLTKIKEGDVTAIIFYCKCKLKDRGYSERSPRRPIPLPPLVTIQDVEKANDMLIQKLANAEATDEDIIPLQKMVMDRRAILETVDYEKRLIDLETKAIGG